MTFPPAFRKSATSPLSGASEIDPLSGQWTAFKGNSVHQAVVALVVVERMVPSAAIVRNRHRAWAPPQIATRRPQIWEAVAALAYQLTRDLVQLLAEAIALPPRQRVAARMVRLAREEDEGGKPVLCLSQEVLAEMVGLTRKTVNG